MMTPMRKQQIRTSLHTMGRTFAELPVDEPGVHEAIATLSALMVEVLEEVGPSAHAESVATLRERPRE